MILQDYRIDLQRCSRCSLCKWLPLSQIKSWRFANACPSMVWGNFHAYSAGGKMIAALALLDGRIDYTGSIRWPDRLHGQACGDIIPVPDGWRMRRIV